ncbi:hypothetical protein HELRODRAFT_193205 [Helobdella robusta]|uniref:Uncharacterized protein n=1 Tax=Helobdella robusta TaxID=6412 RepID=T1FUR2_HELRO|nr:hypothetical protein HELRODRAFT_193205 [Helobdella robusta]ESN97811.1 hypothetical protein HELRODRAFT_193205 [Helobdella robusta]
MSIFYVNIFFDLFSAKISRVVVIIGLGLSFGSVMLINLYKHFFKRPPSLSPADSPQTADATEPLDYLDAIDEVDLMKFKLATDDQICEILLKPPSQLSISTDECEYNEAKCMKYEDDGLTISRTSAAPTNISSSLFPTFLYDSTNESQEGHTHNENEMSSDDNDECGDSYHKSDADNDNDESLDAASIHCHTSFHDDIYREMSLSSCKQLFKCTRRPSSSTIASSPMINKNFNNIKTSHEDTNINELSLKSNLVSDLDGSSFRWGQSLSDTSPISTADLTLLNILLEGPSKLFFDSSDITDQLDVIERDLGKLKLETNELVEVFEIFKKKAVYDEDVKINNPGINYGDVDADCIDADHSTKQATIAVRPYVSTPKSFPHTTEHKLTLVQDHHRHPILATCRRLLPQPPSTHTLPNFNDQGTISTRISNGTSNHNSLRSEEAFTSEEHSSDDSLSVVEDVEDVMFDEWDYGEELGGDDEGDFTLLLSPDFRVQQLPKQTPPGRDERDWLMCRSDGGSDTDDCSNEVGEDGKDDGFKKFLLLKSSSASTHVVPAEVYYEKNEIVSEVV